VASGLMTVPSRIERKGCADFAHHTDLMGLATR